MLMMSYFVIARRDKGGDVLIQYEEVRFLFWAMIVTLGHGVTGSLCAGASLLSLSTAVFFNFMSGVVSYRQSVVVITPIWHSI